MGAWSVAGKPLSQSALVWKSNELKLITFMQESEPRLEMTLPVLIFYQTFGHVDSKPLLIVFPPSGISPNRSALEAGYDQGICGNRPPS